MALTRMEELKVELRELRDLAKQAKLGRWNEFVEEVQAPQDIAAALITGRPELLKLMKPRAMSEDEVAKLYKLIGALIQTNHALQDHAAKVALLVHNWTEGFKTLHSVGKQIEMYAQFDHDGVVDHQILETHEEWGKTS